MEKNKMEDFINSLRAKDFLFYNHPKKLKIEDYNKALSKVKKDLSNVNGLSSIYTWGGISNPGISDIDFLLVSKKNGKLKLPLKYKSIFLLNRKLRYLLFHPFVLIDEEAVKDVRYIYPETNFNFVYGKRIKIKKPSKNEKMLVKIHLLIDIAIRHYPRDFTSMLFSKKINVRNILLRLGSLKFGIKTFSDISKTKIKNSQDYISNIEKLRKDWFNLSRKNKDERLFGLIKKGALISIEIVKNFSNYLEKNRIVQINNKKTDKIAYNGDKNQTIFIEGWDTKKSFEMMNDLYRKKNKIYSVLPLNFSINLIEYSKSKGILSQHIRKNLLVNNLHYKLKDEAILKKRAEVLNKQVLSAVKIKHLHFPAFFDFGCMPKKSFLGICLYLTRKIKARFS